MQTKLAKTSLTDVHLYPAKNGKATCYRKGYEEFARRCQPHQRVLAPVTPGAYGLLLTWREWASKIILTDFDRVLLLEDDIYFHRDFAQLLDALPLCNSPLLYLGGHQAGRTPEQQAEINSGGSCHRVSRRRPVWGSFSLLMNREFLLQFNHEVLMQEECWEAPVDWLLWFFQCRHPQLLGRVMHPPLMIPEVRESDNMGPRDLKDFCKRRGIDLSLYEGHEKFENL